MLYLIHGADSFRAREKLNELIAEFRKKDSSGVNLSVFDSDEENLANKIKAAAETLGFLSPARMIVVKNLFSDGAAETKKEITNFILVLEKKNASPEFIFFESAEIGKKGSAGGKEWVALAKHGEVFLFDDLSPTESRKWVLARLAAAKTKITPAALDKLILYAGNDLWRLNSEIEKLSLLKTGEKEPISDKDIEAMVKSDLPTSIFSTIDALARQDKKTALKLLAGHLEKGEAPIYLFSMFAYQFSNLIKVKDIISRQLSEGKSSTAYEIAGALQMHPYVVKKTIPYAAKFSLDYLKKIYKRLLRFDFLIKKGRIQAETALEMIIVEVGNLS